MIRKAYFLPLLAGIVCLLGIVLPSRADYPQPSPYPISWELTLTHSKPRRIVVQAPGDTSPQAYWYVTYHVVNDSDTDKVPFYPSFDLVTEAGNVIRSDNNIKPAVFDAVKARAIKFLQTSLDIAGDLRHGEDESKDGVAIWREPACGWERSQSFSPVSGARRQTSPLAKNRSHCTRRSN